MRNNISESIIDPLHLIYADPYEVNVLVESSNHTVKLLFGIFSFGALTIHLIFDSSKSF